MLDRDGWLILTMRQAIVLGPAHRHSHVSTSRKHFQGLAPFSPVPDDQGLLLRTALSGTPSGPGQQVVGNTRDPFRGPTSQVLVT